MFKCGWFCFSYLYPDGRSINPDLSWAVQATPEDHVKVLLLENYLSMYVVRSSEYENILMEHIDGFDDSGFGPDPN
jgi:hypothetical protein